MLSEMNRKQRLVSELRAELIDLGGRDFFLPEDDNYFITCYTEDGVEAILAKQDSFPYEVYFDTREEAERAIYIIGVERLKKYVDGF